MIKTLDVTDFQSDTRIKRFKRFIFGVNPAAAEFQHALQTLLADIPVTTNIADDILIFAENTKQHGETLTRVLERYKSKGTTLNLEKSVFFKNNLKYYSFMFSKKGMKPDTGKVKEIQETPTPENKKALQSFLGLTNYMKRFTHDYSIQTYHLRELLQDDKDYIWSETHVQACNNLKHSLNSESYVFYLDNHKEIIIYTDASFADGILEFRRSFCRN